jgi:cytochrome P450
LPVQRTPAEPVELAELEADPHPVLARLRAAAPVCWVPVLGAWLVTDYGLAVRVLRDWRTFTVDDPRFSTARVVGPSMLSLDGVQHGRHRTPFTGAFRPEEVHARLASFTRAEARRLVAAIQPRGQAELRRAVAGPLAAAVMAEALGLGRADPAAILATYDGIVAAVQAAAGAPQEGHAPDAAGAAAFADLAVSLRDVLAAPPPASLLAEAAGSVAEAAGSVAEAAGSLAGAAGSVAGGPKGTRAGALTEAEAISNAAVLLFGGIETTEGMIVNAVLHLLSHPDQLALVIADGQLVAAAIEESLRLEPAAAVVDRYATADAELGGARIQAGEQVTVSIAGANRDPAVFADPDSYQIRRRDAARHLTFAHGPHFCLGAHLARLEARIAIETVCGMLPRLRLDPRHPAAPRGLVFRKAPELRVLWEAAAPPRAGGRRSRWHAGCGAAADPGTARGGEMSEEDLSWLKDPDEPAEAFHRTRREHGGASQYLNDAQDEQLAELTEEERVEAGLEPYDPDEVPPATDEAPLPEDVPQSEEIQEERAEIRREVDQGELWTIDEQHPFPPTRYDDQERRGSGN